MKGQARRWALAGCALALANACGGEGPPVAAELVVWAAWNDDPASAPEIGYQAEAQVWMQARAHSCLPLPDLRITVDGSEQQIVAGDCAVTVSATARPARADADTVVTVRAGGALVGEATFRGLYPGFGGAQALAPADGRVRMGETLALAIPTGWPVGDGRVTASFYWLDPAPSVPPFHSTVVATANAERTAVEVTAPRLAGRAQVILRNLALADRIDAAACAGFARCFAGPAADVLGPVAIEVIP